MRHDSRAFVRRLDFLTSIGHGPTGTERRRLGIRTEGPLLLVSDLCIMRPEPVTKEFEVVSMHPGVTREDVCRSTGWPVRFAVTLAETTPPSVCELDALRALKARTAAARAVLVTDAA